MKIAALLATIASAVSTNAALETYCQTNFGKSISIYVHVDPKNPPGIAKAPWVGLTVQGYSRPTENNANIVSFDLESAVYAEKSTEVTSGKITTLSGFATIEDLSDLVFAAIETAVSTSSTQTDMTYSNEQGTSLVIADFPGWIAARTWTISKHV
jgi:hypothetical protein